jgi:hypothetical protein
MKTRSLLLISAFVVGVASADIPECETKDQGEVCTRHPSNCDALYAQEQAEPTGKWIGCRGATIFRTQEIIGGTLYYFTSVMVDASYSDSERMDITIQMDGKIYESKDVQIVSKMGFQVAEATLAVLPEKTEVPTVKATEKGGKRTASHAYK